MYSYLAKMIMLFLLLLLISCNTNPTYSVTGVILEKNNQKRVMLIDHDKIIGFMDPMIMNFNIHDKVDMDKIESMDSVKFDLVILKGSHYAINFNKIGRRSNSNTFKLDESLDENDKLYSPKKIGERISNVSFTSLDSSEYNLYKSDKDFIIISYIFSRCPMPEMCPALVSKNQYLAKSFKGNKNIEFLLISFDYQYDTIEVLRDRYINIEDSNLRFLSSVNHLNDLMLITKQCDLSFGGVAENNIGHTMKTIILDKNKKILKAYEGLNWKPADLKRDILNFISLNQ
jgi:protein SCO1/2